MSDYSPVGASEHVSRSGRGSIAVRESAAQSLFGADDALFTRPVPIVADRRLGDSGLAVFPFVLGTSRLAAVDGVSAERILHRFATRGGTLYDVDDGDGSGRSQEIVGGWLAQSRPSTMMTSLTPSLEHDGGRATGPHRMVRAVEAALKRLGLEHIDLLMLELIGSPLSVGEQLGVAAELIASGKVRHIGAARAGGGELLEARVLAGSGLPRLVAARPRWDIIDRADGDAEMHMAAAAQQLALLPDATTASITLASPSLPQKVLAGWGHGARLGQAVSARVVQPERTPAVNALASRGREHRIAVALDRVSDELGVPPATTHLAWLLAKRGVVAPVVHVTRPEQIDVLMDSAAVRLTRAQMLELDRVVDSAR